MDRVCAIGLHLNPTASVAEQEPPILYETLSRGRVAKLELNRPHSGNAYTLPMLELLFDLVDRANADAKVVAIVITAKGSKAFCSGADKEMLAGISSPGTYPVAKRSIQQVQLLKSNKPILASIHGACAGLGFVTVCMADLRFAVRGAKFTTAFAKRGLPAEHGIASVLPKIVGQSRAMDLLLSSRVVLAEEALEMGLVNRVFDTPEACLRHTIEYAEYLADHCSPASMAETRHQMYGSWGLTPEREAELAFELTMKSFLHPDAVEGIASLIEKRAPSFPGLSAGLIRDKRL